MNQGQSRQIHTRNSARIFGVNITNYPLQQHHQLKKLKPKRTKSSLTTSWVQQLPEVHPYMQEINKHTRAQQHQSYITQNFMCKQKQINATMRQMLIGWLIQIHPHVCHNNHTIYLAILIIDKYCACRSVNRNRYQLLGLSALFVAAKYEEVKTPKLKKYSDLCSGDITMDDILDMEGHILIALNFKIKAMTICWHLEEYIQFAGFSKENNELCHYILDLSLIQLEFCLTRPTILGWAIVLFVAKFRNLKNICQTQISQSFLMCNQMLQKIVNNISNLYKSRRLEKFKNVSQKYLPLLGSIIA